MQTETIFRVLLFLLFLGFVAHRGYATRKHAAGASEIVESKPAGRLPTLANLFSLVALVATAVYLIAPQWVTWASLPIPSWMRWCGIAIALASFTLLEWAQQTLGRSWSDTPRLLSGQSLVLHGPYRWVRHPIYTAFLLFMLAILLISANWLVGLAWIAASALDIASRIRYEEDLMTCQYGDVYRNYMQETGRLLPRL